LIESVKASAMAYHIPIEELSITETSNRFPVFTLPSDSDIVHEPEAGFLRPDEAIRTFTQIAESKGANILTDVQVTGWKKEGNGVVVTTSKGTYHADRLVITAGPWSAKLIPGIKEKLTVTRQVLAWMKPAQPDLFSIDSFPCWFFVDKDQEGAYYGFPWINDPATNMTGIKVAYHHRGTPTEPDKVNREISVEDTDHLRSFIQKHLPQAMGKIHFSKTCLYSYSPDEHFIIDHVPDTEGRVYMAWGFSGHGFKFASAVGEILADLAIDGKTHSPIDFLRADRFDH
jgi:sarcosine oxidase